MMFRPAYLCEDMHGLYWNENYEVWRWLRGQVYVSFTRQGDAICFHFSADRKSLRHLRDALYDFYQQAFELMPWCTMTIGCIKRDSVVRIAKSCGFFHVIDRNDVKIYARYR